MGDVIGFRKREKRSRHNDEPPKGDAQILFFLGVQYIRIDETQQRVEGGASPALGRGPSGGKRRKGRASA
ncbi:hypothetical protein OGR47_06260 [Methylocystis sp. MJC1]|jgi:hypothetical protein|uniref:hypothetical protein n=1 Tax=Methylocystis sp. MJC1 TaxID=2654282 RepID=UPI0013EA99CF|nr:hypothetical protein [Methylocystis sp. MJC1]KAF2992636.1 hypothetical protein MJC1_00214 [Methylocystis sp. MJC1]MBU6526603.1 hypothetical protein [Methylocystis sp. MJC1]UZX13047.1 hypothetical protein OGR47_06260 [Methylocystis sp. MJC1]